MTPSGGLGVPIGVHRDEDGNLLNDTPQGPQFSVPLVPVGLRSESIVNPENGDLLNDTPLGPQFGFPLVPKPGPRPKSKARAQTQAQTHA